MDKVVRWRGQFADRNDVEYIVNIYGDPQAGVSVKSITLGEHPLVTEIENGGDSVDAKFSAVRTQTGTLEVLDPDGTLMDELMPKDEIDHPVIIRRGSEAVWMGYLSCEAYSQPYEDISHVVTFNLLSACAAMDSVYVQAPSVGYISIRDMIDIYMNALPNIHLNVVCNKKNEDGEYVIDSVFLQTESMVEKEEVYNNDNSVTVSYKCKKFSEVVGEACKLLGLTIYENGGTLYLNMPGEYDEEADINTMEYAGEDNTRTRIAPARDVVVSAPFNELEDYINIPETPTTPDMRQVEVSDLYEITPTQFFAQDKKDVYNFVQFRTLDIRDVNNYTAIASPQSIENYMGCRMNSLPRQRFINKAGHVVASAQFIKNWATDNDLGDRLTNNEGIYATFFADNVINTNNLLPSTPRLFSIRSVKQVFASGNEKGDLHISFNMKVSGFHETPDAVWYEKWNEMHYLYYLYLCIRIGNKYYGYDERREQYGFYASSPVAHRFMIIKLDQEFHLTLPTNGVSGEVEVGVYPYLGLNSWKEPDEDGVRYMTTEVYFTKLDVKYINEDWRLQEYDENDYRSNTQAHSRDNVTIDLRYASYRNNVPCDNNILDSGGRPIATINDTRPEFDLLDRAVQFYRVPREKREVVVRTPDVPTGRLCITDGSKRFEIVGEERDWYWNRSVLTLVENP